MHCQWYSTFYKPLCTRSGMLGEKLLPFQLVQTLSYWKCAFILNYLLPIRKVLRLSSIQVTCRLALKWICAGKGWNNGISNCDRAVWLVFLSSWHWLPNRLYLAMTLSWWQWRELNQSSSLCFSTHTTMWCPSSLWVLCVCVCVCVSEACVFFVQCACVS